MKKLRLLVTTKCKRNCEGCCNHDVKPSGVIHVFELLDHIKAGTYNQIMITGGEPLLFPDLLMVYLQTIMHTICFKMKDPKLEPEVILYTSMIPKHVDNEYLLSIFYLLDGITFTIHDKSGMEDFLRLQEILAMMHDQPKMRLNVFCDVPLSPVNLYGWDVKFIKWIKNCPLPEGEEFLALDPLFTYE